MVAYDPLSLVRSRSEDGLYRESSFFKLSDGDSSDDGSTAYGSSMDSSREHRVKALDLEVLFEFDTTTLVNVASKACGNLRGSFAMVPTASADEDGEEDDGRDSEVQSLKKECEVKDKQIEQLKRTVCELLLWVSAHPRGRATKDSAREPLGALDSGAGTELRASAPEFVSLGIPSLVGGLPGCPSRGSCPRHKRGAGLNRCRTGVAFYRQQQAPRTCRNPRTANTVNKDWGDFPQNRSRMRIDDGAQKVPFQACVRKSRSERSRLHRLHHKELPHFDRPEPLVDKDDTTAWPLLADTLSSNRRGGVKLAEFRAGEAARRRNSGPRDGKMGGALPIGARESQS